MRVSITTAGHTVEIEDDDPDMNVHRLANIAVNTWRRTVLPEGESCGPAYGFTSQLQHRNDFHRTGGYGRSGFREVES